MLMMLGLKSKRTGNPNEKDIALMHMKELIEKIINSEDAAWNKNIFESKELLE